MRENLTYQTWDKVAPLDSDIACSGLGKYYVTGYSAFQALQYGVITLYLGNVLPVNRHGFTDYDTIIDTLDFYFSKYVDGGQSERLTNAATVYKHCRERDHADGIKSAGNEPPYRLERHATLVVVDPLATAETVEELDAIRRLGKIGIWPPHARGWLPGASTPVAKSMRGADTSVAYIALQGDEEFVHREVELPRDLFDEL